MRRDSWIYALAFLTVLVGGAFLIGPRLARLHGTGDDEAAPVEEEIVLPLRPSEAPRAAPWIPVEIRGASGRLRGPVEAVGGAEVRWDTPRDAPVVRLAVRTASPRVSFGAAGHVWQVLDAASIVAGREILLAEAAPSIIVRVRESTGAPAARVPIDVLPLRGGPPLRTDGGGTVVIDDAPPGLIVLRIGGRERRGPVLRLLAGRDRDVQVHLEPAWVIRGRVLDLEGKPVVGGRVEGVDADGLTGIATVTDAAGRFTWRGPLAPTLAIRVIVSGVALAHVKAHAPDRGPLDTDVGTVRLADPSATLEGRVLLAATGACTVRVEPAVAALLRELFGPTAVLDAPTLVSVDADGTFSIPDLPGAVPLRVSVRGGGLPLDDVVSPASGERIVREYAPPPGHVLHGLVRDLGADGRPAVGLTLRISATPGDLDRTVQGDFEVVTDGAGRFRVDGLPRGSVFVRAFAPGRRTLLREIVLPRRAEATLEIERAQGDPSRRITGIVVDDAGARLAGVTVRAAGRTAVTSAQGAFSLDDVEGPSEEVVVSVAFEPGTAPPPLDPTPYLGGSRRSVAPGGDPVRLVLARSARLTFLALDGLDDEPLAWVHVLLRSQDGQILVDRPVATTNGQVVLDGLLPEGATLALFSGRHRGSKPVVLEAATRKDLGTLRLARGMHITGRVFDATGKPVPGAHLGGLEEGWLERRGGDRAIDRELALRHTTTDAEGRFTFDGFDPRNPAVLACWAPGYAPTARRVVLKKFQDSVHATLDVELGRGGYLSVDLVESGTTRPVSGALFDLEDARTQADYLDLLRRGMFDGPVASDDDWRRASAHFLLERAPGRYRIGPAVPGPYKVWVDHPGYKAIKRQLTILDPTDALISLTDGSTRSLTETLHLTWELEPGR